MLRPIRSFIAVMAMLITIGDWKVYHSLTKAACERSADTGKTVELQQYDVVYKSP